MNSWDKRTSEERGILSPSFCSMLLWQAANGRQSDGYYPISFEESYLILPFVLHRKTREELPRSLRTSMPVWLDQYPLVRGGIASRAKLLMPFTRESLLFAGVYGFIKIDSGKVFADTKWSKAVNAVIRNSSEEVRMCSKKAEFIGRWFANTGSAATVFAILGVRP